jgi:F-type H+-transporting ATPase subunit b
MEDLAKLGLNPVLLVAQIVNFLVIGWVIYRFLIKRLLSTIDARKAAIAKGLEDAEKAKVSLEQAGNEREKVLEQAHEEASQVLRAARLEADRIRGDAQERARGDAERVLAEARSVIALERQEMERDIRRLSLDLSGRILSAVVADLFSGTEKERIVARGLERIGKVGAA